jgi:outer membrane lipoprotein-sorting protein
MKSYQTAWMGTALIFCSLGFAQSKQDALDILNRVGETYRSVKTLQAEGEVTTSMSGPGMQQNGTMRLLLAIAPPGKMRMGTRTGLMDIVMIADGETMWLYMPGLNKYSKLPTRQPAGAQNPSLSGGLLGLPDVEDFGRIAEGIRDARVVRSETLPLNGIAADCYVIDIVPSAPSASSRRPAGNATAAKVEPISETVWVDKARFLVVRVSSNAKVTLPGESGPEQTGSTVTFSKVTLDDPVPDETFVFTPPPGATELDLSQFMPQRTTPP